MAYLILARKYRPQTFDEVYAQDHITKILKNTIEMDRTAQAYLFTGPRGVGKTSLARIFAKSLNCLNDGPTTSPCNVCQNCTEITQGNSSDVIEIDGASNTGVEDIRDLQKELMYAPANSRNKIYIIDEVHMLSKNAFNALLKTLEEPPLNVVFIFATTEPHKVIPTIISRCQRFDCKRIPIPAIIDRLSSICKIDGISIDPEALFAIGKKADGSMRDALSLMDQVLAYGKDYISLVDVLSIFGIVHTDVFHKILVSILDKNASEIIELFHDILEKGNDIQEFLNGMLDYIRNLLLLKLQIDIPTISEANRKQMTEISGKFEDSDLLYIMTILIKTKMDIKNSSNPILVTEMAFIKISRLAELQSLDKLIDSINTGIPVKTEVVKPKPIHAQQLLNKRNVEPQKSTATTMHDKTEEVKAEIQKEAQDIKPKIKELTIEVVKESLDDIAKVLSKRKPIVSNYFVKCNIRNLSNNFLHLVSSNSLAYNLLKDEKEVISDIFSKHFNLKIKVDFTLEEVKGKKVITNPTLDDIKKELPIIAEFIEDTDSIIN
ncbi:MAG: DNA polymerase III subunit gamma/tau [Candidatus Cloacimonetes bacterium]|jgi:DNA polymerase-3 subunit gamma/tau|nr:DNA polymerase III subunit gamma/tau [Candidatus Cloacimonadota bacterium]MBT5421230.1 DNA polymerase III subunit gamma/tau [Candidatus Cloacimonadota bacterium]